MNAEECKARLVDAHCHLQDERLAAHLTGVLARASATGVRLMHCCGSAAEDWPRVAALAAQIPAIVPSFGLHPWHVQARAMTWREDLAARLDAQPAGIGEIGLDDALPETGQAEREEVFLAQLELSRTRKLPVSIHCRKAWGRMREILCQMGPHPAGMILHAYSGGADLVPELSHLNAYFSFAGTLTLSNNHRAHHAATAVPAERLLIESDAPDLMPFGVAHPLMHEGKPLSEPAYLHLGVRKLAELRCTSSQSIMQITAANFLRLFASILQARGGVP